MLPSLSKLNPQQIEAVQHTEGPLLILAGAGSGKTTLLINRIGYIIEMQRAKPWQVLAITFTNKAANELKNRLFNIIGYQADSVWAMTFHAACMRILRRDIDKLGYQKQFNIFDTSDQKSLIKACMQQLKIDDKRMDVKYVMTAISSSKDKLIDWQEYSDRAESFAHKQIAKIYELYQDRLKANNALDFDDIIMKTVQLLRQESEILEKYSNQFKYILVDEYQDTNFAQFTLIKMLAKNYGNLCVVGDDDQSIYKFRGATIENILNFEHHFPDAKVIKLEQNYRSTQNILDAANHVIKNNISRHSKKLWTKNGEGDLIDVVCLQNERLESAFVARTISDLTKNDFNYKDFAVLYRMNAQSRAIEEEFVKRGLPYRIVGGNKFHDRKEIKDILAYLKLAYNPNDDMSLKRIINVPARKIGKTTAETLEQAAAMLNMSMLEVARNAEQIPSLQKAASKLGEFVKIIERIQNSMENAIDISEIIENTINFSGYKAELLAENSDEANSRLENIEELKSIAQNQKIAASRFKRADENGEVYVIKRMLALAKTNLKRAKYNKIHKMKIKLGKFLEEMALYTDMDKQDDGDDKIVLMTLHSAKGLEFPVVFMVGMEQNIFPSSMSTWAIDGLDEERRLCYVGITRAKKKLFLTRSKMRMLFGKTEYNPPSQFLRELPNNLTNAGNFMENLS